MRKLTLSMLLLGCAHVVQLVPAQPGAHGEVAQVTVEAGALRWTGHPSDLETLVTPLYVSIHNGSDAPVRVRYRDLSLASGGVLVTAIPPLRIQRPGTQTVPQPMFVGQGYFLYSPYATFYPGLPVWNGGPWDYDPAFYDAATWHPSLPTADMLQRALPEGVLEPGGTAAGFLYFHTPRETGPAALQFEAMDARSREPLGTARVELIARQ